MKCLCDPCVSACALLGFALKAPILGTGLASLKTTIVTPCCKNDLCSVFEASKSSSELKRSAVARVDGVRYF